MQILKSLSEGSDDSFAMVFRGTVVRLIFQKVVERNSLEVLHDDIQVIVGFDNIQNFDYVRMA